MPTVVAVRTGIRIDLPAPCEIREILEELGCFGLRSRIADGQRETLDWRGADNLPGTTKGSYGSLIRSGWYRIDQHSTPRGGALGERKGRENACGLKLTRPGRKLKEATALSCSTTINRSKNALEPFPPLLASPILDYSLQEGRPMAAATHKAAHGIDHHLT